MRMLRTIARALAAAMAVVVTMVWEGGKWIMRCLPGYQPPQPDQVVEEYVNAAETAAVAPAADQRFENIQGIANALSQGQEIPDQWLIGLSERTMSWIEALSPEMLTSVANTRPNELQAHIAGSRAIKGLLAFDPETIAAYQQAMARTPEPEPELERIRRRPRRQEPLLPAFGPMC